MGLLKNQEWAYFFRTQTTKLLGSCRYLSIFLSTSILQEVHDFIYWYYLPNFHFYFELDIKRWTIYLLWYYYWSNK